jgi:hypothetical protein
MNRVTPLIAFSFGLSFTSAKKICENRKTVYELMLIIVFFMIDFSFLDFRACLLLGVGNRKGAKPHAPYLRGNDKTLAKEKTVSSVRV